MKDGYRPTGEELNVSNPPKGGSGLVNEYHRHETQIEVRLARIESRLNEIEYKLSYLITKALGPDIDLVVPKKENSK